MTSPASDRFAYRIGPSSLRGDVHLPGAKNSSLGLLAASLLTAEPVVLTNYPESLLDAQVQVDMLRGLGKICAVSDALISISESRGIECAVRWEGRSIRTTLLILGALVARLHEGAVPFPGGCRLGERKYDLHVMLLERLGARIWEDVERGLLCAAAPNGLRGAEIVLPIRSTGATQNALMCGALASGTTTIWNPHIRPEILDLVALLRKMGAMIDVRGQEQIRVEGTATGLRGATHEVIPDNMEAITWLIGATMTGGDLTIHNFPFSHLEVPLIHLRESGAKFFPGGNDIVVRGGRCYPLEISTGPFPAINSDMQPLFAAYGAMARGETRIVDLRFPGRYAYADEFRKLGVKCELRDNLLIVRGGNRPHGAEVTALDLRAGVALSLLGLVADGRTIVHEAWQIERGYSRFVDRMRAVGADIQYLDAA